MEKNDWIDMTEKMNEVRLFSRTLVHRSTSAHERSTQEYDLLSQLIMNEEGMTPIKLSKAMCLNKTIVSRLIDNLSKSGYITKEPDINDKRSYSVHITEYGRQELQKIYEFYLSPIYKLRKKLGDEEFFKLISYIERANQKMNE